MLARWSMVNSVPVTLTRLLLNTTALEDMNTAFGFFSVLVDTRACISKKTALNLVAPPRRPNRSGINLNDQAEHVGGVQVVLGCLAGQTRFEVENEVEWLKWLNGFYWSCELG